MARCGPGWRGLVATVVLVLVAGAPLLAADLPSSRRQIDLSFAPLVRETGPAVVNIYAIAEQRERRSISPLFDDPFFRRFFGDIFPDRPQRRSRQSLGSGVILDPAGLVVTNHHVIANADRIKVVLADRREFAATLLLSDERTDLAVLQVDTGGTDLPYLAMRDSDTVEVGDLVLAIGNPFGVGQTVTSGIVSALARTAVGITDYSFFIQTDASINPGNSGGALIATDGRLIGINTAIFSGRGGGSVGIGFAIPSNMVRTVLEAARSGGLVRPWIGFSGQTVTVDMAGSLGFDRPQGVIVNNVYPGSAAADAGLRVGDVVLEVDGVAVPDLDALRYRLATGSIGHRATLRISRSGRERRLSVRLDPPPRRPAPDVTRLGGRTPFSGSTVANLSPALALEEGFDDMERGVIVLEVARNSPANRLGLRRGDIVLVVNENRIGRVADLEAVTGRRQEGWTISIRRDGKVLSSEIPG